jgi:sulfate/thiosulfate transport system permease protein
MVAIDMPRRGVGTGRVLPGYGPTLGLTLCYVTVLVLVPLSALFLKASGLGWTEALALVATPRVVSAFRVSFGLAAAAALVNGGLGVLIAWVLVRHDFPGRRILDGIVDLPFALPTAVAGIALATLYSDTGWIGAPLAALGIDVAYTPLGIFVALLFVGLPYVIRTVQPILAELEAETEEVARTLGATGGQIFRRVIVPPLVPAILTGVAMAFARGVGEYGSVIFIAGNRPGVSEILPLLIVVRLEQFDYAGAAVLAAAMLLASGAVLLAINLLQSKGGRRHGR